MGLELGHGAITLEKFYRNLIKHKIVGLLFYMHLRSVSLIVLIFSFRNTFRKTIFKKYKNIYLIYTLLRNTS